MFWRGASKKAKVVGENKQTNKKTVWHSLNLCHLDFIVSFGNLKEPRNPIVLQSLLFEMHVPGPGLL